ncbi:MAG: hypothetical protein F4121_12225, partial [Acidimicrobiia bacterium]|nr:hypothetical protein [Acidimicrobiia bacterium]
MDTTAATATIEDDDTLTASVADLAVSESEGAASIRVTLSSTPGRPVTFSYATANGSATAVSDYTAAAGTLTIPSGTATANIPVTVVDDAVDGPDRTFTLTLSDPQPSDQVTLSRAVATVTITDDEDSPTLSLEPGSNLLIEGASTAVRATLSTASSEEVTVTVSMSPVAPAVAGDFTQTGTTLTIAAGATTSTGTVTLTAVDNELVGPASIKRIEVSGSASGGNGVAAPPDLTVFIIDNDRASLGFDEDSATVTEGDKASFTVTLSREAANNVTFRWRTGDPAQTAATAGTDYTAQAATDVTIEAGSTSATLEVQTTADTTVEANEKFAVKLSGVTLPSGV